MKAERQVYSTEEPRTKSERWSLLLTKMAKRVRAEEGGDGEEETKILRETVLSIALLKEGRCLFCKTEKRG